MALQCFGILTKSSHFETESQNSIKIQCRMGTAFFYRNRDSGEDFDRGEWDDLGSMLMLSDNFSNSIADCSIWHGHCYMEDINHIPINIYTGA